MRVQVLKSDRDNSLYAKLPECMAFFNDKIVSDLIVGNSYDVMIAGFSKKVNKHTNLPAVVFLNLVQENDILVEAKILECAGSMCSTSTWHKDYGPIYPGHNTPVPTVDNVNTSFHEMPSYPTPVVPMWIRKNGRGAYSAIGVESYEHIDPVFLANHAGIKRVREAYQYIATVRQQFSGKDREFTVDGLHLWEAIAKAKVDLGIIYEPGYGRVFGEAK